MQQKQGSRKNTAFVVSSRNVCHPFYSNPYGVVARYPSLYYFIIQPSRQREAVRPDTQIKTAFSFFNQSDGFKRKYNTGGPVSPRDPSPQRLLDESPSPPKVHERKFMNTCTNLGFPKNDRQKQLKVQVDSKVPMSRTIIYQPDFINESPSKLENKLIFDRHMRNRSYYDSNIDNTITLMQKIVASKEREREFRHRMMNQTNFFGRPQSKDPHGGDNSKVNISEFHRKRWAHESHDLKLDTLKKFTPITTFQKSLKDCRISNNCKIQLFRPNLNS